MATEFEIKHLERPNPKARIGFVIFYPFQFYVFKNVYKHLSEDAEFIIDTGRFFPNKQPADILGQIVSLLGSRGVNFRILSHEDYFNRRYLEDFFSKYGLLVSLWWAGCIRLPCNLHRRKAHMNYGAGKELAMFNTRKRLWDLYLCLGPYIYKTARLLTYAKIVGYPKFDDWFNKEFDFNFMEEVRRKLDATRKTILYLPTHSDLSSIRELKYGLAKLSNTYNVIVKLHYYTPWEDPELVKSLSCLRVFLFKDEVDLLPLMKIADVVVSDNSSAIFDAILADKPVVVADFTSEKYLDDGHRKIKRHNQRFPEGALTYSGSIEQVVKRDGLVTTVKKPDEMGGAIKRALADDQFFKEARSQLRNKLFSFNDGRCGERTALLLTDLLYRKELPKKPLLYHILESDAKNEYFFFPFNERMELLIPVVTDYRHPSFWRSRSARKFAAKQYMRILRIKALPFGSKVVAVCKEFFF